MTNRMSNLDTSRYCALSGRLAAEHDGSSLAAAAGSAFHAKDAGVVGWQDQVARLPQEWKDLVNSWIAPPDNIEVSVGANLVRLQKAGAMREREVRLDVGDMVSIICIGHVDMAWVLPDLNTVVVIDLKRSRWTCHDGPYSLQLQGYGMALADEYEARHYLPAIWSCDDGELTVGELETVGSVSHLDTLELIESAATNIEGPAVVGSHCLSCWQREHCPEFLMPGALAETALGPAVTGALETNEQALECLLAWKAAEKVAEVAEKNLKTWAQRHGGIYDPTTHKVWGPVPNKGRSSLDRERLERELNISLSDYMRAGKPGESYVWTKPRLL